MVALHSMTTALDRIEQTAHEAWLTPNDVMIDRRVNPRELDTKRARQLAQRFNPNALGTIYLSWRENGDFIVIDGQHRLEAMRLLELHDMRFRGLVYEKLTTKQEAELFEFFNGKRTSPPLVAIHYARLTAQDREALTIRETLARLGLRIATTKNEQGTHIIRAILTVEQVLTRGGADHLFTTVLVTKTAWPNDQDAFLRDIILGVSAFLQHHPNIEPLQLAKKLQTWTPGQVIREVRQVRQELSRNPTATKTTLSAPGLAIRNVWNHKRRSFRAT